MTVLLPALIDPHVHLRVPGGEHKETVATGTAAALAGGYRVVLAMPNTQPPLTDAATLTAARSAHIAGARCDVGLYAGATEANADAAAALADLACGLKIYVNDTYGQLRVERLAPLAAHFRTWPAARPLVVHAEGPLVAAAIGLAAATGRAVHIAHVSTGAEIELIAAAKQVGLPVTCEVTPHHLLLTAGDMAERGGYAEVRPRLATADDRAALWAFLHVVDCLATDHAPHTRAEKEGAEPPPGYPGLETALPLLLTAVAEDRLTLDRLVELTSTAPARIFGLPLEPSSTVEVDPDEAWVLPEAGYQTLVDWTPFAGWPVRGRVVRTTLRGRTAFENGEVLAAPGSGRVFPPVPTPRPSTVDWESGGIL